jgi:hypothetical protein
VRILVLAPSIINPIAVRVTGLCVNLGTSVVAVSIKPEELIKVATVEARVNVTSGGSVDEKSSVVKSDPPPLVTPKTLRKMSLKGLEKIESNEEEKTATGPAFYED